MISRTIQREKCPRHWKTEFVGRDRKKIIAQQKSAATAVAIVIAIAVVMVTTAVIMLAAIAIGAGTTGGDLILRAPNYESGSSIVINIVYYRLSEKLCFLGAHIDLYAPALEDQIILLLIAQRQAVVCAC